MKKLLKSKLSSEQDFDSKTIQHLEHDFMVEQCLKDASRFRQLSLRRSNNSQAYIGLLNQVGFRNRSKRRRIDILSRQTRTAASPPRDSELEDLRFSRMMPPQQQLLTFEKKIQEEEEIKSHLLAEMAQISKSIVQFPLKKNLQRGDVSRMITKNECTNVLEKKTNKVRIIALDQLKKVSSALSKDHAEIQERNNMQIKFNKRLRNISNNEAGILTKIKTDYCKIEKRKNTIFSKINKMEEIIKTLDQHEKKGEDINVMKERNKMHIMELINLMKLIKQVNQSNIQQAHKQKDDAEQETELIVDELLLSDIDTFKQSLAEVENYVIQSIKNQMTMIDQSNECYNYSVEKLQEKKGKLKDVEEECADFEQLLFSNNKERFSITRKEQQIYSTRLNEFQNKINLLFILWGFVENHAVFTTRINQINLCEQSELTKQRRQQNSMISRFYRKSEQFKKNTMVTQEENRYISRLHALFMYLERGTQDIDLSQQYIFKQLEMNIILWLKGLKNLILEGRRIRQHLKYQKKPKSMECWKIRSSYNLEDQPAKQTIPKQFRTSQTEENEDKLKTMLDFIIPKKSLFLNNTENNNHSNISRFRKTEGDQQGYKPERVKFMDKVDQNYYKMIKSVLQIQKENIKKNYDFSKTFNRAKYTQKNILQEQKRYQSTFALEFIRKNEKINEKQQSQKSESPRDSVKEEINRKRRPFHHQTEYVMNFNAGEKSSSVSNFKPQKKVESNLKKSVFNKTLPNVKPLQRHSMVSQPTQVEEKTKTIRTSVLNLKRSVINFLEPDSIKSKYAQ